MCEEESKFDNQVEDREGKRNLMDGHDRDEAIVAVEIEVERMDQIERSCLVGHDYARWLEGHDHAHWLEGHHGGISL